MAMKQAFCCMSTRMGTLIFIYLFLITFAWEIINSCFDFLNPVYHEFLKSHGFILFADIFITLIGCIIFLANIIQISNNTPSIFMLNYAIGYIPVKGIFNIYTMFIFTTNGLFCKLFYAVMEIEIQKQPSYLQDSLRTQTKDSCQIALKLVYFLYVIDLLIAIYALLVFHGYKTELKENSAVAPASRNVNDKEANFTEPPAYIESFMAPQHPFKLTQCSA